MEMTVQEAIDSCRRLESQLRAELKAEDVSYIHAMGTIDQIRAVCTTAIFQDFEAAAEQGAESRLWSAHQMLHTHFKSTMAKARKSGADSGVECRRLGRDYLKFIKQSQKFYRGFVRDLAAAYGGIPELERVAGRLSREYNASRGAPKEMSDSLRKQILLSCYWTLVRLGDLSRYRETELATEPRDWAPAVGFYDLALTIYPSSGAAHNQLAIIALTNGNMFRAIYHVYRALFAEEPYPQAESNMSTAFRKITNSLQKKESLQPGASKTRHLVDWYLRLVTLYNSGNPFSERDELEDEVLSRLEATIRGEPQDSTPYRMVLINVSAGQAAGERLRKSGGEVQQHMDSYLFFLRFNLRTMSRLVLALENDLVEHCVEVGSDDANTGMRNATEMPDSAKSVLPAVRLYNTWLLENFRFVATPIDSMPTLQRDLWRAYSRLLTRFAAGFPISTLPQNEVMLDEDVDTLGFQPFRIGKAADTWYSTRALETTDDTTSLLLRIKSILTSGLKLVAEEDAPLSFDHDKFQFFYEPDGSSEGLFALPASTSAAAVEARDLPATNSETFTARDFMNGQVPEDETDAQDIEAQRMVDNLVEVNDNPMTNPSASLDTLPENNDPKTPPQQSGLNYNAPAFNSSYAAGTLTADALVNSVKSYTQRQHSTSPQNFSPRIASQMPSPASVHRPQLSSYASVTAASDGSTTGSGKRRDSPTDDGMTERMRALPLSASGAAAMSPMVDVAHAMHSRVHSTDSNYSMWAPEAWRGFQPPGTSHPAAGGLGHLGNGTFGVINQDPDQTGLRSAEIAVPSSVPWAAQYGPAAPHSPWNANFSGRKPTSTNVDVVAETPPIAAQKHQWNARPFT